MFVTFTYLFFFVDVDLRSVCVDFSLDSVHIAWYGTRFSQMFWKIAVWTQSATDDPELNLFFLLPRDIKILDQITEAAITQITMTGTTDRTTTETMAETEVTSNNRGMNREIRTTQTGMTITKIETGSKTEEDQTNTNTTGTNTKLKSSLNSQTKT